MLGKVTAAVTGFFLLSDYYSILHHWHGELERFGQRLLFGGQSTHSASRSEGTQPRREQTCNTCAATAQQSRQWNPFEEQSLSLRSPAHPR